MDNKVTYFFKTEKKTIETQKEQKKNGKWWKAKSIQKIKNQEKTATSIAYSM